MVVIFIVLLFKVFIIKVLMFLFNICCYHILLNFNYLISINLSDAINHQDYIDLINSCVHYNMINYNIHLIIYHQISNFNLLSINFIFFVNSLFFRLIIKLQIGFVVFEINLFIILKSILKSEHYLLNKIQIPILVFSNILYFL